MHRLFNLERFEETDNPFDCPMCSARFHAGLPGFEVSEIGGERRFNLCDDCGFVFLNMRYCETQNALFESYIEEIK